MNKKILYLVLTVLIVSNLPVFTHYIAYKVDNNYYQLSNYDGSFTAIITFGFKDGGWSGIYTGFDSFISETNPPSASRIMYRIYRINPLCFWRWYHYFMMYRHFPYMDWEEIKNLNFINSAIGKSIHAINPANIISPIILSKYFLKNCFEIIINPTTIML